MLTLNKRCDGKDKLVKCWEVGFESVDAEVARKDGVELLCRRAS